MRFVNEGNSQKIRIGNLNNCVWKTVETREIIELEKSLGLKLGFKKVTEPDVVNNVVKTTEGQIGNKKVETKQIESDKIQLNPIKSDYTADDLFFKELTKINGIGAKTAKDIVIWGTKEKLIEQISLNADLPFRDDVVNKLRKKYG